ncbi:MAG: radical SAM protein [Elusimicrobiota bacterium]
MDESALETRRGEAPLARRYCENPFTMVSIHNDGDVFLCCPSWIGFHSIGNVFRDAPRDLFNSAEAVRIRAGILDGSFDRCDHEVCPRLAAGDLPLRRPGDETRTVLPRGPLGVKLAHDDTCNLSCPSCRAGLLVAGRERQAALDRIFHEFILPLMADARILGFGGDGDPFASRHYRNILRATAARSPLRIVLQTNAQLCDERAWDDCALGDRVDQVQVSIDAAEPKTYAIVRRGGNFDRLTKNLGFLSRQRAERRIKEFQLAFVVQALNFREMPSFVRLGKELGADRVIFMDIDHWDRAMTDDQFRDARICSEDHPLRPELSKILRDPILSDPIVDFGNLSKLPELRRADRRAGRLL